MSAMEETQNLDEVDGAALRRMALARLRYERLMGVETVPRVAVKIAAAPTTAGKMPATPDAGRMPALLGVRSAREIAAAQLANAGVRTPSAPAVTPQVIQSSAPQISDAPISGDIAERWSVLEAKAMACQACVLANTRKNVVFGTGNRSAKLVFVGEGPGQDEDEQGEPFVGKAGQLLNKIIGAMGLRREDVYICNVVKCRPPQNRTPLPDEVAKCTPYLMEQIALVSPKVIVALGSPAAKTLLNTTTGIMSLRGRWHMFRGIPLMPTFHPAFVLRTYTPEVRGQVWSDMQQVMEKLKDM